VNGETVQTGTFSIIARPENAPGFGPILFAESSKDGQPTGTHGPRDPFVSDTNQVVAFFEGLNIDEKTRWTVEWYHNGNLINTKDEHGITDRSPIYTARLNNLPSLSPGTYLLKLIIDGETVQMATFVVEP
jgi:hypothetical protein